MKDPQDVERRYVVGATLDTGGLEGTLASFDARLTDVWPTEAEGGQVVMVEVPDRHAGMVAERLGPNAQILDSEAEARQVAKRAATPPAGRPGEAQ